MDKFDKAIELLKEASTDFTYQGIKRVDATPRVITLFDILMQQHVGKVTDEELESKGEIFDTAPIKKAIIQIHSLNKSNRSAYRQALNHPLVQEDPARIEKIQHGIKRCEYIEELLKELAQEFDVFKI